MRGEAERVPLHPIRVIPAREVSGKPNWISSLFQYWQAAIRVSAYRRRNLAVVSSLNMLCAPRVQSGLETGILPGFDFFYAQRVLVGPAACAEEASSS